MVLFYHPLLFFNCGDYKYGVPEQVIHCQMAEGLIGTQQRTDSIREKDACEREHGGGTELKEYPVTEHIVCAIHVPLADADGIDRNASNADEHIHRA